MTLVGLDEFESALMVVGATWFFAGYILGGFTLMFMLGRGERAES